MLRSEVRTAQPMSSIASTVLGYSQLNERQ